MGEQANTRTGTGPELTIVSKIVQVVQQLD